MPTSSLAPSYSPSAARLILKAICITFHPWLKWLLVFYRISPKLLSLRVKAEVRTQASRPISAYTYVPPPHTYTDTHTHTCSFTCALHLCTHQPCRLSARCQPLGLGISSVHVCTHTCTHTYMHVHTHTPAPSSVHFTYAPISHADCLHDASFWAWASALCVCAHTHAHTHMRAHTHAPAPSPVHFI